MQKRQIYRYYAFGYNYRLLQSYQGDEAVHGRSTDSLIGRLENFFEYLDELSLRVTLQAAKDLKGLLEEARAMPQNATVDSALAKRVRDGMDRVDATLDAELELTVAYVVMPKRYATAQLIDAPDSLLAEGVFLELPALSQFDFAEACNCIAFERPTAAAFHLMRCVEGVLRAYYCHIVKRDRVKRLMWFDMVSHLGKRKDAPPRALLDNLDTIRANFRNPTQHPDARYDVDEAQDLLAVTIDAISRMARDRKHRSK